VELHRLLIFVELDRLDYKSINLSSSTNIEMNIIVLFVELHKFVELHRLLASHVMLLLLILFRYLTLCPTDFFIFYFFWHRH